MFNFWVCQRILCQIVCTGILSLSIHQINVHSMLEQQFYQFIITMSRSSQQCALAIGGKSVHISSVFNQHSTAMVVCSPNADTEGHFSIVSFIHFYFVVSGEEHSHQMMVTVVGSLIKCSAVTSAP